MSSIHQIIYDTMDEPADTVLDRIMAGDIKTVMVRRNQVKKFLEENQWDENKYKDWLRKNPALPNIAEQAKNIASSVSQHILAGLEKADDELSTHRWDICLSCENLVDEKRCALCGCYMKVKSTWAEQTCPIEKW